MALGCSNTPHFTLRPLHRRSIPALTELKQLSSGRERPFSGWGMALPLLRACTSRNRALVPEGILQAILQVK